MNKAPSEGWLFSLIWNPLQSNNNLAVQRQRELKSVLLEDLCPRALCIEHLQETQENTLDPSFQARCLCLPQLTSKMALAHHQHSLGLEEPTATSPGQCHFISNCIHVEKFCS